MRFQTIGNKADICFINVKNASAGTIPAGAPVFLALNGTDDGIAVTDAYNAAAAQQGAAVGILTSALNSGQAGEAVVFGVVSNVRYATGTRAASSDNWGASHTAVAVGDALAVVTVSGVNALTRNAAGATGTVFPQYIAAGTVAGAASTAASTGSNLTKGTTLKVFVRLL